MTVPPATPLTIPDELTVALAVLLLLHVPPAVASLNVVVAPLHTDAVPVIVPAVGAALTVTTLVATAAPQLLITV